MEKYWNGAILDSVATARRWAANMTWKGLKSIINLVMKTYEKKVKVAASDLQQYKDF